MMFGMQVSQSIGAVRKVQGHTFPFAKLPPENPEEEKRIRFEIDFLNQMNEPKEKKSDLLVD